MNFPKILGIGGASLFALILGMSYLKNQKEENLMNQVTSADSAPVVTESIQAPPIKTQYVEESSKEPTVVTPIQDDEPMVDRIEELFILGPKKSSIVETITYTSRVPWLKGRPAWIADYASHYKTSRHFIARSLNRKPDYLTQKVSPGDRFNVLRSDIDLEFYLLVDIARCKMWFYYLNKDTNEKTLLKTYKVGLGSLDSYSESGVSTPIGKYRLGDKVASYKPGVVGFFKSERVEMMNVFGSRWLPFKGFNEDEDDLISGYGIHGAPLYFDEKKGELIEDRACIGKYESIGCIRLYKEDVEELYSIVVTRPTTIEIVKDSKNLR